MYHFIVNPHSRSQKGREIWTRIMPILEQRQIPYQVFFTKYRNHASAIASKLTCDEQEHILIALGGDGTINEVLNGIRDYSKVILGYIPTGSSNDFARGLKLPTDPIKALESILSLEHIHAINIGTLTYGNNQKQRDFAVSTGIGFDASVCLQAAVSKLKLFLNRLHLGKLTYAGIGIHRIFLSPLAQLTLTLDQAQPLDFPSTYFTAVMNLPYEGGGFKFCPAAIEDDGFLDVIVVSHISKLEILLLLPAAFLGKHTYSKKVHLYRCKKVRIETDIPLPVHADGEPVILQKQIEVACGEKLLRIISTH